MIICIQSKAEKAIFDLYSSISKASYSSIHRIAVESDIIRIYMGDSSLSEQKIIVNQVKQFMRDNSYNYTMELK